MMRLFTTSASGFVRKVTVTIKELGIESLFEFVPTRWPHTWGTHTVPFRPDFAAATRVGRIPVLVTDDGLRLCDSSQICEYLNAEYGDYRLCPANGKERWRILSVLSIANGLMEARLSIRAETLRKGSDKPSEYSQDFVDKMTARRDRCHRALEEMVEEFPASPDLGQIAVGVLCGLADFRYPYEWRPSYPQLARWYETFRERPSMRATEPSETPTKADDPVGVAH